MKFNGLLQCYWNYLRLGFGLYLSKKNLTWFTPPIFYGIVIGYYVLGGTLFFSIQNNFIDRGINLRDTIIYAIKGWGCFIWKFFNCLFFNFQKIKKKRYTSLSPYLALKLGRFMNKIGIFFIFLVSGPAIIYMLNPFSSK